MSDGDEDAGTSGRLTPSWLAMPSPRALLDRTTKFVLNAAHGKSRSLIPTTDNSMTTSRFDETGIVDWDDNDGDVSDDGSHEGSDETPTSLSPAGEGCVWRRTGKSTALVLECDVLRGHWNAYQLAPSEALSSKDGSTRPATPPGMLRIHTIGRKHRRQRQPPPRLRTPLRAAALPGRAGSVGGLQSTSASAQSRRPKASLMSLPHGVICQVFEYLPVPEMLELLNSCRLLRRVMHRSEPSTQAAGEAGDAAYTPAGIRVWRAMIQRMGWLPWQERSRGRERRPRLSLPKSHAALLRHLCAVEGEGELVEIMGAEPDLLFKAVYDNLCSDYVAFRSLEHQVPALLWGASSPPEKGKGPTTRLAIRSPAEVAARLDQLQWFGRGHFTHDAAIINRRLAIAADKFEAAFCSRFKHAFIAGRCAGMREAAEVLEHLREGRGCIRILVGSHPLFNSDGALHEPRYAQVLAASDCVTDSHSFGVFLEGLQGLIEEHARVSALALPPHTLPASALYCFVQALFGPNGVALLTLQKLYAYLRSIPVLSESGSSFSYTLPQQHAPASLVVVPDEATKDVLYLTTVADVVALLLVASGKWAAMKPVALSSALGRRCVFSAFDDVIGDYVQLERRVIERAYGEELTQWIAKANSDGPADSNLNPASIVSTAADVTPNRSSPSSLRSHAPSGAQEPVIRLVNFHQRLEQMEEYKLRVLHVLEAKLGIGLPAEDNSAPGPVARRRSSGPAVDLHRHTTVGSLLRALPISIDLCLNMLLTNRDAINRLSVFAEAPPDMRLRKLAQEAIESVFCILLQSIGNHVRPAFARIVAELKQLEKTAMISMVSQEGSHAAVSSASGAPGDHASATSHIASGGGGSAYSAQLIQVEKELREKFTAVELRFFELIHLCDLTVQMLEIYYKKDMCVFINESDFLNICNQEKKALEHAIDDNVAVGMDCVIEIILRQTHHILDTEQRSSDYHPDSNTSLTLTPTMACARAVQFLSESTAVLQCMTTQKQMRDVFLGEIGVRLFNVLLDNIKRFQITEPGGFQLIADLNLYYDWAVAIVDPDTLRFFTALKDLANCFILAPKDLRGFLRDQYSRHTFDGVMRSEEVYDVVACRADYRAIRSQVEGHCDFM
ncbi:F-box protein: endocytic membrane traffic, recycling ReCYcling 1 [Coemansia sp. RSA 2050]|nr:F-box protein: endocytic membrane traffic, recycling ReCYcling 1 [Coemansia sp. RSA 2050]KAJ2733094.1 F-box protein: endocytic membrane traffic, recycling ReCYcling 1 [Coemansia sp. BCRC 34962]